MKKNVLAIAVAAGLAVPMAAQAEIESKWYGFSQITAELGDGIATQPIGNVSDDNSLRFGADRVRIGYKMKDGNVFGGLQVDFVKTDSSAKNGNLPEIIKDAYFGYKFSDAAKLKLGSFKTPVGMDFNTSGKKLDITKRGMEKKLVLERDAGAMLSGRKIGGGFGYDLFIGNPAGRSAVDPNHGAGNDNTGEDLAYAGRVMYDMGKTLHVEASYGLSPGNTDLAPGIEDYTVYDLGVAWMGGPFTVKGEYIAGSDLNGVTGSDQTTLYAHFGWMFTSKVEGVIRHYYSNYEDAGSTDIDLGNTYIGANFFLGSNKTNGRIQVNYVLASGDDTEWFAAFGESTSSSGYVNDALLTQYQISF